jgi:hypothetical protein
MMCIVWGQNYAVCAQVRTSLDSRSRSRSWNVNPVRATRCTASEFGDSTAGVPFMIIDFRFDHLKENLNSARQRVCLPVCHVVPTRPASCRTLESDLSLR